MNRVVIQTTDSRICRLLANHPGVALRPEAPVGGVLSFAAGRVLHVGTPSPEFYGIVELEDNNPLVCARAATVPGPAATLSMLALGPLWRSGVPIRDLRVVSSISIDEEALRFLGSATIEDKPSGAPTIHVLRATGTTEASPVELRALFDEAYGRAFYVQQVDDIDLSRIAGRPWAHVALRSDGGKFEVEVGADRDGKLGAAQCVHAFNVMAGFEECLGIPDELN